MSRCNMHSRQFRQLGFADRAPLFLHLAVALILCQLMLWLARPDPTLVRAHGASTAAHLGDRLLPRLRLPPFDHPGGWFIKTIRTVDPGLAMTADSLDAESRYFVAMALEDCYALSHDGVARTREDFARRVNAGASNRTDSWIREVVFANSIRQCATFDGMPISPERILDLLQSAARDGDPRAQARTLLFRDLADSKVGSFDLVTRLLSSGDPYVIRDVGLFLTRGESSITINDGSAPVRATTLAVAWELVACDFGLDCGSDSKILNNLCAYQGQCGAFSYADWLGRYTDSSEELAEIRRLRLLLRRGLIAQDWSLLGLSVLKPEVH